ncbi:MAG: tRNA (guanosine(37)-N1)-methyltransferase TrmD [Eubacteriales bacterium]
MRIDILTLFPEMVETVLGTSIIGRARQAGKLTLRCHQIREYADNKHRNVDDTPYGGGAGMVMAPQPILSCYRAVLAQIDSEGEARANEGPGEGVTPVQAGEPPANVHGELTERRAGELADRRRRTLYMSPKGTLFNQQKAAELATYDQLVILCGHYEGVDQRVIDSMVDEEISIGDYVLTGGELPACVLVDAVARHLDGVLACAASYEEESIASGLLEYPHYTHPAEFEGRAVPEVLLSGHHAQIAAWRLEQSLALTRQRRPDLYEAWCQKHPASPPKKTRR